MKIGIMQPYFFPYIGYWQLMNAVDKYVVYDDVNYITRGWITRNRLCVDNQAQYFNLPTVGASQNKKINEILTRRDERLISKLFRKVEEVYKKAPFFADVFPIFETIMQNCDGINNIAEFMYKSFTHICSRLSITTELVMSSSLDKDNELRGEDKVIAICKLLGADEYINAIGGRALYESAHFAAHGIKLRFLETHFIEYRQFAAPFIPGLSILDVMMFNSPDEIRDMLGRYELIE